MFIVLLLLLLLLELRSVVATFPSIEPSRSKSLPPSIRPSLSISPSFSVTGESSSSSSSSLSSSVCTVPYRPLVFFGNGPHNCLLPECAGHCTMDDDCSFGLVCYHHTINDTIVPGCDTIPYEKVNYCVSITFSSSSSSNPMNPTVANVPSSSPSFIPTPFSPSVAPTNSNECPKWVQAGQDMDGEAAYDQSGRAVAISSDGTVVAIGAGENTDNTGHVRVYVYSGTSWNQRGSDIMGEAPGDKSGRSLAMSNDGTVIAVGAVRNGTSGHVRVFYYNNVNWTLLGGTDIDGEAPGDRSGEAVALSANGKVVAIGAPNNNNIMGQVRVFFFDTNTLSWKQRGGDIDGTLFQEKFGIAVAISSDGNVVATATIFARTRVHAFHHETNAWEQVGTDFYQGGIGLDFPGFFLDISSDGTIVAVGDYEHDLLGTNRGVVRVYRYNKKSWNQLGNAVAGEYDNDRSGFSVAMSSDGTKIAVGAKFNDGNGNVSGHVRVYSYSVSFDLWTLVGNDIDGESENDRSGSSVAMSSDGTVIAIGAVWNKDNGIKSGHVRVMQLQSCPKDSSSTPSYTPTSRHDQCSNETSSLHLELTTDRYPNETTWNLIKFTTGDIILSGGQYKHHFTLYKESICLERHVCYQFTIYDSNGDGICCGVFSGYKTYKLFYETKVIRDSGDFGHSESTFLGNSCPTSSPSLQPSSMPSSKPSQAPSPSFCLKGNFFNATSSKCQECKPGTFQDEINAANSCNECSVGHYQNETGATNCNPCPKGFFQSMRGQESCIDCRAGEYQEKPGQISCQPCQRGLFQPKSGQEKCIKCRAGGYCDNSDDSDKCDGGITPCPSGTFNNNEGESNATACHKCPAGEFTDQPGNKKCSLCPYRLASFEGDNVCSFCAEGFYLKDENTNSSYLSQNIDHCLPCPPNVICVMNTNIKNISVAPGFWRDSISTTTVYRCNFEKVCISSGKIEQSSKKNAYCKDGYSGPLCEVCDENKKYFNRITGKCDECPPFSRLTIIPAFIIGIGAVIVVVRTASSRSQYFRQQWQRTCTIISSISIQAKLKVLVSFFQVIATLEPVYGVKMDSRFKSWFDFLTYFNFGILDFTSIPGKCFGSMRVRLLLSAMWPYGAVLLIIIAVILYALLMQKRDTTAIALKKMIWYRSLYFVIIVLYLVLPSVSSSIFDAIKCQSFDTDDKDALTSSYLLADGNIRCDKSDEMDELLQLFWLFFALWPIMVPSVFSVLLWFIRKTVYFNRITLLSEACRFLWRDYKPNMMFWEVLDIVRKIFLTGPVMFIDREEGSSRIFRLIIAIAVSTVYFGLLALAHPYKRTDDLYFSIISNVLLICCFLLGIIIQVCGNKDDSCERFILPFLENSFEATVVAVSVTAALLGIIILFMAVLTRNAINAPTVRVVSTSNMPNLEIPEKVKFHAFMSHVWATGQDKAHKIVRMIQLVLPGLNIWLDVDNLEDMSQLEISVNESALFILFYSKGYFKSDNCIREVSAAVAAKIPTIIIYEGDDSTINIMKQECHDYFTQAGRNILEGTSILDHVLVEPPILWLGSGMQCFASESIKLVILRLLHHLPYYHVNAGELSTGLILGNELGPVGVSSPLEILYCDGNEGVHLIADEVMKESSGLVSISDAETILDKPPSELEGVVLLLYLNQNLFLNTSGKVKELLKSAFAKKIKIVLAHEKDVNKGGCEFDLLFNNTPQELIDPPHRLYSNIAIPIYTLSEYRKVSLRLLLSKMGAIPVSRSSLLSHSLRSSLSRRITLTASVRYSFFQEIGSRVKQAIQLIKEKFSLVTFNHTRKN